MARREALLLAAPAAWPRPERVVVLTLDDAAVSHATFVAPQLKECGFGATFFVCTHTHVNQTYAPRPESFAYPAYETNAMALEVLAERGYKFARAGGSRVYRPELTARF